MQMLFSKIESIKQQKNFFKIEPYTYDFAATTQGSDFLNLV